MSKLGSLYIRLGEPEGEMTGCCETADWAADEIERLMSLKEYIWAVVSQVNDYNQHGDYLIAVFLDKPNMEQLLALGVMDESEAQACISKGGQRIHVTQGSDSSYFLKQIRVGGLYQCT